MIKKVFILTVGLYLITQPISAQTWTASKRMTWTPGESSFSATVIDSSDNIHVVWSEDIGFGTGSAYWIINYKRSTDGGNTWSGPERLSWDTNRAKIPSMSVDSSDNIHLVWEDQGILEVYYQKSIDGGTTWSKAKRLTWSSEYSRPNSLAIDSSDNIHIAIEDNTPGNWEIYYKKSTNGGTSWTTKRLTYNPGMSYDPFLAVDSKNHIHVVFWDDTPGNYEIYYKRSTDGGVTWTTKRLTFNSGYSLDPAIFADVNDILHVLWGDSTPKNAGFDIYYKKSTDGGITWTTTRLTWISDSSREPALVFDSYNILHLVWRDSALGNFEIYCKKSTNGGTSWSKSRRLTWNSGNSWGLVAAIDSSDDIHIIWEDETPSNWEIFYKKGIQ